MTLPPSSAHDDAVASDYPGNLLEQLNALRHEDEVLYNIVAIDVWALAKTMDAIHPGFWAEFMSNREKALRQFMAEMSRKPKADELPRPPFLQ